MPALDPAGEFLRVTEHYRRMYDEELVLLARQKSKLTDLAQQALASEVSHRRLQIPSEEEVEPLKPEPPLDTPLADDVYAQDRQLVELCKVWSLRDALRTQWLLDRAGIPFYIGPHKATEVNEGTLNFADGVSVKVMRIGLPWAAQALQGYTPADEPPQRPEEPPTEPLVRCPACDSADVILEDLIPAPAKAPDEEKVPAYKWACDACGHRWEG